MQLLKRLFVRKRRISQAAVARRAAALIERVIFDVGSSTLVGGTFVLDRAFRLRFLGTAPPRRDGILASVQVSDVAESGPFRALALDGRRDTAAMRSHGACLANAVVRELGVQSAAFRALPALEA